MPGNPDIGNNIEALCLKTVESDSSTMECINNFYDCISHIHDNLDDILKIKVQAFLATKPEIATSLGRGAQMNYWDFDSTYLNELKVFLENFR